MRFISHRANLTGSNPERENLKEQIDHVIYDEGFDCEIDIRFCREDRRLYLGHDHNQEEISIDWLLDRANQLWIHCKNLESLNEVSTHGFSYLLNYFFHNDDEATLTSKNFIWVHPKARHFPRHSVVVLPLIPQPDGFRPKTKIEEWKGICADNIKIIRDHYKK